MKNNSGMLTHPDLAEATDQPSTDSAEPCYNRGQKMRIRWPGEGVESSGNI